MSRCLVGGRLERTLCVLRWGIIARERNLKINKKRHPQLCVCCGPHEEDKARRAVCGFLQIVWMKRRSCLACVIIPPHLSLFPDHPLFFFFSLSLCSPSVSPFFFSAICLSLPFSSPGSVASHAFTLLPD